MVRNDNDNGRQERRWDRLDSDGDETDGDETSTETEERDYDEEDEDDSLPNEEDVPDEQPITNRISFL